LAEKIWSEVDFPDLELCRAVPNILISRRDELVLPMLYGICPLLIGVGDKAPYSLRSEKLTFSTATQSPKYNFDLLLL
jgi:hypothetical protein